MEEKTIPILQLRIKHRKLSRSEARKAKREYDHFLKEVEPIEIEFCDELFDESPGFNYHSLYSHYLCKLNELVEYLNRYKYKIIEVDSHFFEKNYKPIENIS